MSFRKLGIKYRQLPSQRRFHRSKAKFKAYVGGYGSGKTYAGCHEALRLSFINAGLTGMIIAPTYRMMEDATLPTFREILERNGIECQIPLLGGQAAPAVGVEGAVPLGGQPRAA